MSVISTPIEVFYSYADADEDLCIELEKHLNLLQRDGLITLWHKRLIIAGTDWTKVVDQHLNTASIILLLISANFMASDYCYGREMQRAIERHNAKEARVIPILLRPVDHWQGTAFGKLQMLPSNGKPITLWNNQDAAFADVVAEIRRAIQNQADRNSPSKQESRLVDHSQGSHSPTPEPPPPPLQPPRTSHFRLKDRLIIVLIILLIGATYFALNRPSSGTSQPTGQTATTSLSTPTTATGQTATSTRTMTATASVSEANSLKTPSLPLLLRCTACEDPILVNITTITINPTLRNMTWDLTLQNNSGNYQSGGLTEFQLQTSINGNKKTFPATGDYSFSIDPGKTIQKSLIFTFVPFTNTQYTLSAQIYYSISLDPVTFTFS